MQGCVMLLYDLVQESVRTGSPSVVFPVHSTNEGAVERDLTVVFTSGVLPELQRNPIIAKKTENVLRYGYIGASRGGRNGIVDVRASDRNFLDTIESFLDSTEGRELMKGECLNRESLRPVKIVAHIPQGVRPIGFLDIEKNKVYIIGMEKYE